MNDDIEEIEAAERAMRFQALRWAWNRLPWNATTEDIIIAARSARARM